MGDGGRGVDGPAEGRGLQLGGTWASTRRAGGVRVGIGCDVHRLVEGRELWLGGVLIPYHMGLSGHSDADVLLHAICDALLGAAGLGDIGRLYPSDDPAYEGIASTALLGDVARRLQEAGFVVKNVDATLVADQPRVAPYTDRMRRVIGQALGSGEGAVGVKATTCEGLGWIGAGEGMAAIAVATLAERPA